jgi:hypothetical protein
MKIIYKQRQTCQPQTTLTATIAASQANSTETASRSSADGKLLSGQSSVSDGRSDTRALHWRQVAATVAQPSNALASSLEIFGHTGPPCEPSNSPSHAAPPCAAANNHNNENTTRHTRADHNILTMTTIRHCRMTLRDTMTCCQRLVFGGRSPTASRVRCILPGERTHTDASQRCYCCSLFSAHSPYGSTLVA